MFEMFFVSSGEWITNLTVSGLKFPDVDTYQAVILSKFTPNLESLYASSLRFSKDVVFQVGSFEADDADAELRDHNKLNMLEIDVVGRKFPQSGWMQLLRRYPKLQTLLTGLDDSLNKTAAGRMLESIGTIRGREDATVLDLKCLCMYIESEPPYTTLLRLLRQKRLILEGLGVAIGGDIPNETIVEILVSQAATLKEVWLCTISGIPREVFHPPRLDLVTTLDLTGFPFRRLTFLKRFISLKSLSIRSSNNLLLEEDMIPIFAQVAEDELGELVIPTLWQFHCDYDRAVVGSFSPEDIQKLGKVMPKQKGLQLWLTNDTFRAVCKTWPGLEQFHIIGNEVDDEGITGVVDGGGERIKENISVFQELKSLKMSYKDWKMKDFTQKITLQSHMDGFIHLPNLKNLEIGDKKWTMSSSVARR